MSVLRSDDMEAAAGRSVWGAYASVAGAVGGEQLGPTLLAAANLLAGIDEVFTFGRYARERPTPILSAGATPGLADRALLYAGRFYGFDPAAAAIITRRSSGIIAQRVRAEQIEDHEYRVECYDKPGLSEKVAVAMRQGQDAVVLNFYRSRRRPRLGERAYVTLVRFAELALPLLRRHAQLADSAAGASSSAMEQLQARLAASHPALTARERSVVARTMLGQTAQSIAEELGVAPTSVLTYRRRAYARLRISGPGELVAELLDR